MAAVCCERICPEPAVVRYNYKGFETTMKLFAALQLLKHAPELTLADGRSVAGATAAGTLGFRDPGNERHGTATGRTAAATGSSRKAS